MCSGSELFSEFFYVSSLEAFSEPGEQVASHAGRKGRRVPTPRSGRHVRAMPVKTCVTTAGRPVVGLWDPRAANVEAEKKRTKITIKGKSGRAVTEREGDERDLPELPGKGRVRTKNQKAHAWRSFRLSMVPVQLVCAKYSAARRLKTPD